MESVKINSIMAGLKVKAMDFTDMICWLYEKGSEGWDCDLMEIKLMDYIRFHQNMDSEDMKMTITDTETLCKNGVGEGIDIYNEENFVGASLNESENDLLLKVKDANGKVQAFVLAV